MSEELVLPKTCLVLVDAQPPTFGMVMSIMSMVDRYDEIVICVRDNPICIPTKTLLEMLSVIFKLPKFMVISHQQNFEEMVDFPQDLPFFNYVASMSDRVCVNLSIKGYGCYLMPRVVGYDECFHRHAWRQGSALDILRSNIKRVSFDQYKNPTPSEMGGGE